MPKLSFFFLLIELQQIFHNAAKLDLIFLIAGLLSLILGSVSALTQYSIKRLLAYSTISNVGFILLALSTSSASGLDASLFYLIQTHKPVLMYSYCWYQLVVYWSPHPVS